ILGNENEDEHNIDFTPEQSRPWPLLHGGGIAALILAILIAALVMTKPSMDQETSNMVRAGSPEFDAYKDKVRLEIDPDTRMVYPNMIGMWQLRAKAKLSNLGDRELVGVEVIGRLIDYEDKVLAHAVKLPIPRDKPGPLKPGQSDDIFIGVDAPVKVTEAEVKDLTIELRGLRFR
ncbi:MAG TPA: hypothetical protein VI479_21450, partial [Blastocatellia bacterium]